MRIGKFFIGWRSMGRDEAEQFNCDPHCSWRGYFIEWGGPEHDGFGLLIAVMEDDNG